MRAMVSAVRLFSIVSFGSIVGLVACGGSPSEGLGSDGLLGGESGGGGGEGGGATPGTTPGTTSGGSTTSSGGSGNTSGGSCTPKCQGKVCGADGCGGQCGTCGGKQTCSASGDRCDAVVPPGATCPPTGATGQTVGKVIIDGDVPLKQGGTYPLRANCAKPIYILGVTESCGICMAHLADWTKPNGFFEQLKKDGADVVLIHATNKSGAVPTAQETANLVNNFSLSRFIVGTDAAGNSFNSFIGKRTGYGGARIAITVKPGNIIGQVGQIDSEADVRKGLGL